MDAFTSMFLCIALVPTVIAYSIFLLLFAPILSVTELILSKLYKADRNSDPDLQKKMTPDL